MLLWEESKIAMSYVLRPIEPGTNPFVVPRGTMMLIKTRDMLSLVLYLADTAFCTIYVMVKDRIDLIITALEDRVPLRTLAS